MRINNEVKLKEIGLKCIRDSKIEELKVLEVINCEENFVIKGLINNEIYYFKYFFNPNIKKIKSEIELVNFLRKNNIIVPEFYEKDNKILFENKQLQIAFYGSKEIKGNNKYTVNKLLIEEIIDKISDMHRKIITVNEDKVHLQDYTDKDRLIQFYNTNKEFVINNDISKYIELAISKKNFEAKKYPIHSDLYFKNMIFNDNKIVGFIDFSDIRKTYIEEDLGKLFQNLLCVYNFKIETIEQLIQRYKSKIDIPVSDDNIYISILYRTIYRCYMEYKESNFSTSRFKEIMDIISNKIQ